MAVGLNQIPGCDPFHGITFKDKLKFKMASENEPEDYLGLLNRKKPLPFNTEKSMQRIEVRIMAYPTVSIDVKHEFCF
jgi:hypothetical protein